MDPNLESYRVRIAAIHRELGIPADYASRCGMPLQLECTDLVESEPDVFGRQPLMEACTFDAWREMKADALRDEVELQLVSAWRSVDYQKSLLVAKLQRGQVISDILKVNAAPGYSEHHTGTALDLGCPGVEHLCEDFEDSAAFRWLSEHAARFGFRLSFPRGNPFGVQYEPWHWRHHG